MTTRVEYHKNEQVNDALPELKKEFEAGNNKEYEIKTIINNMVYDKKINN